MCPTGGSDENQAQGRHQAVEYETLDLGALYQVLDTTRLGVMVKNIVGFSFKDEYSGFALPTYATLGVTHTKGETTITLDSEYVFGRFGGYEKQSANIWFLRGGIEHGLSRILRLRAGLVYPVIAETSASGDLKKNIPGPGVGASLGVGLVLGRVVVDLAVYGDPARSYVEQTPSLGATGTLTYRF